MSEETLFHEVLAKSPAERAAFLDAACAGQPELRQAVERLLAAHAASVLLLDQPAVDPNRTGAYTPPPQGATGVHMPQEAQPGYVIAGRYTLEQKLGEGGMGEVWVAKQTAPVKRRVALKLIKAGMDSRAVLQRFEAERQALALMDHPNIAKVLDGGIVGVPALAGSAEDRLKPGLQHTGHPFFVMELVNGLPLNKFCDEAKLTPKERLELFVPICQAVQHAHQKGIIHRDLKPSNILVTLIDGRPVPKVIDFGVAKATAGKLTDESLSTNFGAVVGTLEYMAPEQAGYAGADIDTRADIYSLGVILYEMLTGLRPIDSKRLQQAALTEMIRIIKEEEPSKPSTRLSTEESLPSLAALRQTEPKKLMAMLRGELDWIVMKCLEKQRDRRYETANGLARDIQRYLADEPVEARPPSFGYRAGKFLKRHKGPVIAAGLVLLALLAGMVGTTWGLFRAERSAEAERLAKEDAKEKQALAEKRLTQIEKGNKVLLSIFDNLDIRRVKERTEPLEAVLAKQLVQAAKQLEGEAVGDPLLVAELQHQLGVLLVSLGFDADAILLFEKALQTVSSQRGADHPNTLACLSNLAMSYNRTGRPDKAVSLFEEILKLLKAKRGASHVDTLTAMNNLASRYTDAGQHAKALPLYEEALQLMTASLGADHPNTLMCGSNLADCYRQDGQFAKAFPLFEATLPLMKAKLGADHPDTLTCMNNLALGYRIANRHDKAVPLYEEILKLTKARMGADHPDTLSSMSSLATSYLAVRRLDEALPLLEETLKLRKAKHGADHPATLITMGNLAIAYYDSGRRDQAFPLLEEVLKQQEKRFGRRHLDTILTMSVLARFYANAGRLAEAIPLYEEVYHAGNKDPELREVGALLLDTYVKAGKATEAAKLIPELLADLRQQLPKDSPQLAGILALIGSVLLEQQKWVEAESLLRESLAIREKKEANAWTTFNAKSLLGGALFGQKKYAEAEPLLLAGYEGMKKREKTIRPEGKIRLTQTLERLVQLYEATGKKEDAAKWRKEWEANKAVQKKLE